MPLPSLINFGVKILSLGEESYSSFAPVFVECTILFATEKENLDG